MHQCGSGWDPQMARANIDKAIDNTLTVIGAIAAVVAGYALIPALFFAVLFASGCKTNDAESFSSPNGRWRAVVYERNCGTLDPFMTHVAILSRYENPVSSGNVFIAPGDREGVPYGSWGGPLVTVRWTSDSELLIGHHPATNVSRARTHVRGVRVTYTDDLTDTPGAAMDID